MKPAVIAVIAALVILNTVSFTLMVCVFSADAADSGRDSGICMGHCLLRTESYRQQNGIQ